MNVLLKSAALLLALALPVPGWAETPEKPAPRQERQDFIAANVLWIFYHEMAHALIDKMDLPVLGKEEDAADQLAVLLSDKLWDEDHADTINAYASSAFWQAAQTAEEPMPWWDEHSTDEQRHFTIACLYFGGDPDKRRHVLEGVGLPQDRAELCIAERQQVEHAWGGVLDKLSGGESRQELAFEKRGKIENGSDTATFISALLADEVASLNRHFSMPAKLSVVFLPCGEENAFYDPGKSEIQICAEYPDFLDRLY